MESGVTPSPDQMADMRSKSTSKHAQHRWPRFRMKPRGVRLLTGQPAPRLRASSTDEKNGKFVSTKLAHGEGRRLVSPLSSALAPASFSSWAEVTKLFNTRRKTEPRVVADVRRR